MPARVRPQPLLRALLLFAALSLPGFATRMHAQAPAATRPNVLLVLTDDLDLMLGTMDHLPNIRRLLTDSGMTFTSATVSNSVCCPSRSTLLRGQYTHSHRVYTNAAPSGSHAKFVALGRDTSTLAVWMQRAGYHTALLGKYLNGYPGRNPQLVPPGWTTWSSPVAGGYRMFGYTMNENGTTRRYGEADGDYITDVLLGQARGVIAAAAAARQPFFMEVATYAPHGPSTPAPRHATLLPGLTQPRTPSLNEADVTDKPDAFARDLLRPGMVDRLDSLYRRRVLSMLAVDEMIASLVATLADRGQLANTYIIFTSDNGFHLGQHRLAPGKTTAYEEDVRVPFIVRGPGVVAGARTNALVENVDLAPTITALAGVTPPDFVEGRSIVPLLHGARVDSWRSVALVESYAGGTSDARAVRRGQRPRRRQPVISDAPGIARYVALRGERFTYISHRSGARELYDLSKDPYEIDNLAARTDPPILEALERWTQAMHACAGESCRAISAAVPAELRALVR